MKIDINFEDQTESIWNLLTSIWNQTDYESQDLIQYEYQTIDFK